MPRVSLACLRPISTIRITDQYAVQSSVSIYRFLRYVISVIIPVYNVASYLQECLDSVLAQTYTDFELLLVDDGSTDGSSDLCDDYACRDARVTVIHQPNAGPAAARNAALQVAQGDYLAFIDADDVVHRQYLEVLASYLDGHDDVDVACVSYRMLKPSVSPANHDLPARYAVHQMSGDEALLAMLYQRPNADSSPWGKIYRRSLFEGLRFPAAFRVYEDLYLLAQLYPLVRRMACIGLPLYYYRKQDTGTLNSLSTRRNDAFDVLQTLEAQYMVTGRKTLARAARERRLAVAMNILRLLSHQPHTDANIAMAHRCWQHIKALRGESIRDAHARPKNRLAALLSYLISR